MKRTTGRLGNLVLAASEQSCRDRQMEVREHLLRTLEAMERDADEEDSVAEELLHRAYRAAVRPVPGRRH